MIKGTIFNIQRYTIHDGPGIRTEIFFKGCPLRCDWCSNPESQRPYLQPGIYRTKCIGENKCGFCKSACPNENVLSFTDKKISFINRARCVGCMKCADACPADAIKPWGQQVTVDYLMDIILKDAEYFKRSGGGVTLSGGEPLLQSEFAAELLKACKVKSIHTCVESCFHAPREAFEQIAPYTDLFITDIKHMDSRLHKKHIGAGNEIILQNIIETAEAGKPMIIRIPVIPGINDDEANITATADFINENLKGRVLQLQLLHYMHLGEEKYKSLDIKYPMDYLKYDKDEFTEKINKFKDYFNSRGINCISGTTTNGG